MEQIKEKINQLWFHEGGHLSEVQRDFYIDLLTKLNPKTCLEIGFAGGRHTATMLYSCNPTKAISVDIDLNYHGGLGSVEKIKKIFNNIEFIEGNSSHLLNEEFFKVNFPKGVDYVLVDGGHSYNEALNDMVNCYPFLSKNGIMIVDDYESSEPIGCPIPDVDNAVKFFANSNNLSYETIKLSDGKGMAIFKK